MRFTTRMLLLAVVVVVPACGGRVPSDVRSVLNHADDFELLSLGPRSDETEGKEQFHGHRVLGKVSLPRGPDRDTIRSALLKGINDSDGDAAMCFDPGHGIRATHKGKLVELVICYGCKWMKVRGDVGVRDLTTTDAPAAIFNKLLKEKDVPVMGEPLPVK